MFRFAYRLLAPGALVLLLAGCASNSLKLSPAFYADHRHALQEAGRVAVITDACVVRDQVGVDYIIRVESTERGKAMRVGMQQYLHRQGLETVLAQAPFVCGNLRGDPPEGLSIADAKGDERAPVTRLPILIDGEDAMSPETATAMNALLAAAALIPATRNQKGKTEPDPAMIEIARDDLSILRDAIGARHLVIAQYSRLEVSAGKSLGVAMITGLASAAMAGPFIYASYPITGANFSLSLIDLDRGALLWKRQIVAPPVETEMRKRKVEPLGEAWAEHLLKPLFGAEP